MRIYLKQGQAIDVEVGGRARGNAFPRALNTHNGEEFYLPIKWVPEHSLWEEVAHWAGSQGHSLTRPAGFKGPGF
jgi:hypothetical protein